MQLVKSLNGILRKNLATKLIALLEKDLIKILSSPPPEIYQDKTAKS